MTINQTRQWADQSLQWDRANREIKKNASKIRILFRTLHLDRFRAYVFRS